MILVETMVRVLYVYNVPLNGREIYCFVFNFYTVVIALMKRNKDFLWSTADAWTSAVRFFFLIFIFYQNSTNMLLNSFYGIARLIQFVAAARYNIESQANIFSLVIFTSILKSIKITYRFPSTSIFFSHLLYPIQKYKNVYY